MKLHKTPRLGPLEKFDMLDAQDNKCDICKRPFMNNRDANLDHDHSTGKIRAYLCRMCNTGLGCFGDDIDRMAKAILYLKKHS